MASVEKQADLDIIWHSDFDTLADKLIHLQPDSTVLDLRSQADAWMDRLQSIYQAAPTVPLIVLTDHLDVESYNDALHAGATDVLTEEHIARLGWVVLREMDNKPVNIISSSEPPPDTSPYYQHLRRQAEKQVDVQDIPGIDRQTLIRELEVHKEELHLQLEDLRQQYRKSEAHREQFERLFNMAPTGYVITDAQGYVQRHNATARTLFQTTDSLSGSHLATHFARPDRDMYHLHLRRVIRTGNIHKCQVQLEQDATSQVMLITGIATGDATDLYTIIVDADTPAVQQTTRTTIQHLQKTRTGLTRRLKLATEAGKIGIWEHDLRTGKLIVDARNLQMYLPDYEGDSETFDNFADILNRYIHPDDLPYLQTRVEKAIKGDEPYDVEFRLQAPGYPLRYIKAQAVVVYDEDGTPLRMVGVSRDITSLKKTDQMLRSALAREKDLNDAKSRFVSLTSHELRNPLATIAATTETLQSFWQRMNVTDIEKRFDKILRQTSHMQSILENLLQLSRIESGTLEIHRNSDDLTALCQDVIESFRLQAIHESRIVFTADETPVIWHFDRRLLTQILTNLISNALRYSPDDETVEVTLNTTPDHITLTVADKGIGIPPDDIPHLFEPFQRAANVSTIPGTGLGLSVVKEAVDLHDRFNR